MKHHNDRAGSEEEKRFEKRMSEQVKHRRIVGREANRHHHVTELRERGVSENPFDVVLLRCDQRSHHRGDRADPGNNQKRCLRRLNNKRNTHQHVNACCHHGRCVDQRGNWRWTFHGVRQPDVQRKLGRFADRSAEDQ